MAIPFYWINYKWSDKATMMSKVISLITMFGGASGILSLIIAIIDLDIEATVFGLLIIGTIILLNIYSEKLLQKIAKKDIESKIAQSTKFATAFFLEHPTTLSYILKINPNFEPVYRNILKHQWYCSKCGSWNSVDCNTCDCGAIKYTIHK